MNNYMVIHKYITVEHKYGDGYDISIMWNCESSKDAILNFVNHGCSKDFYNLYKKATTTLTDVESIKLYNLLLDDENEIIGIYEISKEVYVKKNSLYIDDIEGFVKGLEGRNEEGINIEE